MKTNFTVSIGHYGGRSQYFSFYVADISLKTKFLYNTESDVSIILHPKLFKPIKEDLILYATNISPIDIYSI